MSDLMTVIFVILMIWLAKKELHNRMDSQDELISMLFEGIAKANGTDIDSIKVSTRPESMIDMIKRLIGNGLAWLYTNSDESAKDS